MGAPRVTIGLPVYNGERFVAEAIESVLAQTYPDWELVITDNASTDATEAICRSFAAADERIRYYRNTTNVGLARNFNRAFHLSQSPYFKWLAHDDVCLPEFIQRAVETLDAHPGASVVYPRMRAFDGDGKVVPAFDTWSRATEYCDRRPDVRFRRFLNNFQHELDTGTSQPGVYIFGLMRAPALKRTRLMLGHMWADITLLSELLLEGEFIEIPVDLMRARVAIDNATSLMLAGDLQGWQQVLDPRRAGKVGTTFSRYARYAEAYRSVARSELSGPEKLDLWGTCTVAALQRGFNLAKGAWAPASRHHMSANPGSRL